MRSSRFTDLAAFRRDFRRQFTKQYLVRFHMTIILTCVVVSGVAWNALFLRIGFPLTARFIASAICSYFVFFLLVRLWLALVRSSDWGSSSVPDIGPNPADLLESPPAPAGLELGGGRSGGAGASGDFGSSSDLSVQSSSGGGADVGLDLGDGCFVAAALAALAFVFFGAGVWAIYQAPAILSDAAFELLLATGLARASKKIDRPGWLGSVFRATWIPFLIVLAVTAAAGVVIERHCPEARKLADVFRDCMLTN